MRPDTSFSNKKLTMEEFADKYWMGGDSDYVYQYHTAGIEDGRDEREQFIFNNIRALYNLHNGLIDDMHKANADALRLKRSAIWLNKIAMALLCANVVLVIAISIKILL